MKLIYLSILLFSTLLATKVEFEVLGSGGPEIDGRASTSYIVWIDDKARLLIDAGSGSMLRFEQSGAKLEDLEAIVLTHLHIDHCVDLPSYVKAGYFSQRREALPIIGPYGNRHFPDIKSYLVRLFGSGGAYEYMSDVLSKESDSFQLYPVEVDTTGVIHKKFNSFSLDMTNVNHGIVPAIAVRINVGNRTILISGDTSNSNNSLQKLAKNVDLFVAHHAIPEYAKGYATNLHMKPSGIANVAKVGSVKRVLLTHRMRRTLGEEKNTLKLIHKEYKGSVVFAEDRMKIKF